MLLLYSSNIFLITKHKKEKKISIVPTGHLVFHYWIMAVALCNANSMKISVLVLYMYFSCRTFEIT